MISMKDRLIVALDVDNVDDARKLVEVLAPSVWGFKVGLELITAQLGGLVTELILGSRSKVFWDGKLPDIRETNARAAKVSAEWGVHMLNVHANIGVKGMKAVVENCGNAQVLAVTVLTSLSDDECKRSYGRSVKETVIEFADMALEAGVHGLVCSPRDLGVLSGEADARFRHLLKVTPGVRPTWADNNDQKRVMTPGEAIIEGADFLVVGRPITRPPDGMDSAEAARRILDEVVEATLKKCGGVQ